MYVIEDDEILDMIESVAIVHATEEELAQHGTFEPEDEAAEDFLTGFDFTAWKPRRPPGEWHGPITYMTVDEDERLCPVALWFSIPAFT
jgi:hypothetical protein